MGRMAVGCTCVCFGLAADVMGELTQEAAEAHGEATSVSRAPSIKAEYLVRGEWKVHHIRIQVRVLPAPTTWAIQLDMQPPWPHAANSSAGMNKL